MDGFDAKFFVEPDEDTKAEYRKLKEENEQKKRLLQELKGKENITKDGTKINLYANIGGVSDVANVLANDAGGIGLFRSEFLYLESEDYPTEEAQFAAYKTVAENMAGKKLLSVHLISEQINRSVILALRKKKTRQWVTVRSGSASTALKFLRHSFGQSTVPAIMERLRSCSR